MSRSIPFAAILAVAALAMPFSQGLAQNKSFSRTQSNFRGVNSATVNRAPQRTTQRSTFNTSPRIPSGGNWNKKPNLTIRPPSRGPANFRPPSANFKPQVLGTKPPRLPQGGVGGGNTAGKLPGRFPGKFPGVFPNKPLGPNVNKPNINKPNVFNPNIVRPNIVKPPVFNPNVLKPNVLKPNVLKPNVVGPNVLKPNVVKPDVFKPVGPGGLNVFKPNNGKLAGLAQFQKLALGAKKPIPFKPLTLNKLPLKLGGIKNAKLHLFKAPQCLQAKSFAVKKLGLHPACHWWVDYCMGWNWHMHHCYWWDHCYLPGYWNCWTPCHYQVIYCPPAPGYISSTWYFGLDCVLIPDMGCYGVQKVQVNSPAALAGLQAGDMIISVNGHAIADEGLLQRSIQTSGGILHLGVVRDGAAEPVAVQVVLQRINTLSY